MDTITVVKPKLNYTRQVLGFWQHNRFEHPTLVLDNFFFISNENGYGLRMLMLFKKQNQIFKRTFFVFIFVTVCLESLICALHRM